MAGRLATSPVSDCNLTDAQVLLQMLRAADEEHLQGESKPW